MTFLRQRLRQRSGLLEFYELNRCNLQPFANKRILFFSHEPLSRLRIANTSISRPNRRETALRWRARLPVISLGRIKRGNGDPGGRTTPSWPFRSRRFAVSARQSIAGRSPNLYDLAVRQQRHLVQWLTSPPLVFRTATPGLGSHTPRSRFTGGFFR